jgi:branched-chain amino acid transport system ATP-binding protein
METLLEVRDIHTFIGQYHILQGVSLSVSKGSVLALLGRNGAGKTTTLKTILGLTPPREGEVIFGGRPIHEMRSFDIAALGIGFVPEQRAIFRDLSVEENLKIAERKRDDLQKKQELIFSLFPDLKRLIRLPDNRLLLIDEPTEGLAPVIIEQLILAIRQLSTETTILLVEQNFIVASQLAEDYVIIEEGKSVKAGKMADLIHDEQTIHCYLGAA